MANTLDNAARLMTPPEEPTLDTPQETSYFQGICENALD